MTASSARYAWLPYRRPLQQLHGSGLPYPRRPGERRVQPGAPSRRLDPGSPRPHQRGLPPFGNRGPEREVAREMERLTQEWDLEGKIIGLGIDRIDYTKGIPIASGPSTAFSSEIPSTSARWYSYRPAYSVEPTSSRTNSWRIRLIACWMTSTAGRHGQLAAHHVYAHGFAKPDVDGSSVPRKVLRCELPPRWHEPGGQEYVASRYDHDGVLILSPFTGAALELTDALIVNPYDIERFAESIREAVRCREWSGKFEWQICAAVGPGKQYLQVGRQVAGGYDAGRTPGPANPSEASDRSALPDTAMAHLLNVWLRLPPGCVARARVLILFDYDVLSLPLSPGRKTLCCPMKRVAG